MTKMTSLLSLVATVVVGGAKRFVAKDELKAANVVFPAANFKQFFLNKIEENIEGATLNVHCLKRPLLDVSILAELGDCAEIQLYHFFELLKKQSKGEAGVLLVDGYMNIAYVRGSDGNLWAVLAGYSGRSWGVHAVPSLPARWLPSSRFISR